MSSVWAVAKMLLTSLGRFLLSLFTSMLTKYGEAIRDAVVLAAGEIEKRDDLKTWQEKLDAGVSMAVTVLEARGLTLGKHFWINEVISYFTAYVANRWIQKGS